MSVKTRLCFEAGGGVGSAAIFLERIARAAAGNFPADEPVGHPSPSRLGLPAVSACQARPRLAFRRPPRNCLPAARSPRRRFPLIIYLLFIVLCLFVRDPIYP